ncbi:MAG: D-alanyl-D-alanine carboxypeptidase [Oscillospiraceae bacterium]|nr:D-alanyl-D-alanine carboxypeptidase [Oscillospiraceae bacterium]
MKKIFILNLTIITAITAFIFGFGSTALAVSGENDEKPLPEAKAYVLAEAETGEILLAKNEAERLPVTSLAKIMTLLLVAEEISAGNITLEDSVPAPAEVMALKAPVIWLNPGEIMPLGELVKSVVISSSNDAALALAVFIGGSAEEFTARMNRRASELGMNDTFFADPGGFDQNSYSTARDVALMTAELFSHELFGEFYKTRLSAVREGTERETQLVNTNKLAQWYNGILGGKAGQSPFAGFCAAVCAERDDMRLVAVVIGAENDDNGFELCEVLLDGGFRDYEFVEPEPDTTRFSPVKVMRGVEKTVFTVPESPARFIAPRGYGSRAEFEYSVAESIAAPVKAGQVVGNLIVRLGDKVVFESDIITLYDIEELTFAKSFALVSQGIFCM